MDRPVDNREAIGILQEFSVFLDWPWHRWLVNRRRRSQWLPPIPSAWAKWRARRSAAARRAGVR